MTALGAVPAADLAFLGKYGTGLKDPKVVGALTVLAVLAVQHYGTLVGVSPGAPAAWALPAGFAVLAAAGAAWGLALRAYRPQVYRTIGLGVYAQTGHATSRHGSTS